jgi:hypothetical protein
MIAPSGSNPAELRGARLRQVWDREVLAGRRTGASGHLATIHEPAPHQRILGDLVATQI